MHMHAHTHAHTHTHALTHARTLSCQYTSLSLSLLNTHALARTLAHMLRDQLTMAAASLGAGAGELAK